MGTPAWRAWKQARWTGTRPCKSKASCSPENPLGECAGGQARGLSLEQWRRELSNHRNTAPTVCPWLEALLLRGHQWHNWDTKICSRVRLRTVSHDPFGDNFRWTSTQVTPLPRPGAAPTTFYYIIPTLPQAGEGFLRINQDLATVLQHEGLDPKVATIALVSRRLGPWFIDVEKKLLSGFERQYGKLPPCNKRDY